MGMQITFLGVRGSYPVSDCRMRGVGGNSASIMVEAEGETAFLDAGTGIIGGGQRMLRRPGKKQRLSIFLTHLHTDHIQGLPFFPPVYDSRFHIRIYCPLRREVDLGKSIQSLFMPPYSPVTLQGIKARLEFIQLDPNACGPLPVAGHILLLYRWHPYHPVLGSVVYRLEVGSRAMAYATDIESPQGFDEGMADFIRGVDVLIHDSQYRDRDYFGQDNGPKGFGHSPLAGALINAHRCRVKKLFLFHFDPGYSDTVLEAMLRQARREFPATYLAKESQKISIRS